MSSLNVGPGIDLATAVLATDLAPKVIIILPDKYKS